MVCSDAYRVQSFSCFIDRDMDSSYSLQCPNCSLQCPPLVQGQGSMNMSSPFISQRFGGWNLDPLIAEKELQRQHLKSFWRQQMEDVNATTDFKPNLPIARIKRIMKSDKEVKMVSADAPVLLSKAIEFFILELTKKAWFHAEDKQSKTLQRVDIEHAVRQDEVFDFLDDVVPIAEDQRKVQQHRGKRICTECFPNNGMNVPQMNANPVNQAPNENFMFRQLASQRMMMMMQQHHQQQQLLMLNPANPTNYEPPQVQNQGLESFLNPRLTRTGAPTLPNPNMFGQLSQEGQAGIPPNMLE